MTRKACASVLELSQPSVRLIGCFARPSVLDQLHDKHLSKLGPLECGRVAPDELLVVVPIDDSVRLLEELSVRLGSDPGAIALDRSDAFYAITLLGSFRQAFARMSAIELPDGGFIQGLVAGIPCKLFVTEDRLLLLAPSTYMAHLRERTFASCVDLGVQDLAPRESAASAVVAS